MADLHASYERDAFGSSPWARLRGHVKSLQAHGETVLLTNGGDDFEKGSIAELNSQGKSTRLAIEAMRFDLRVLGNHDFAWSLDETRATAADPFAAVVLANVRVRRGPPLPTESFIVLDRAGWRIGVLGLTSGSWDARNRFTDETFYPELSYTSRVLPVVKRALLRYRAQVDLFIILSHRGLDNDLRLLRTVNGVDLVLGGHSHTVTPEPVGIGRGYVIHPGAHGESFAELRLVKDTADGEVRFDRFSIRKIDGSLPVDERVAARLDQIIGLHAGRADEPIAPIAAPMDRRAIAGYLTEMIVNGGVADLALFDTQMVSSEWPAGMLTERWAAQAFCVERQPAGTPGFSAIYVTDISAEDAAAILSLNDGRWAVAASQTLRRPGPIRLALPKRAALHREERPAAFTPLSSPTYVDEAWSLVVQTARSACRSAASESQFPQ